MICGPLPVGGVDFIANSIAVTQIEYTLTVDGNFYIHHPRTASFKLTIVPEGEYINSNAAKNLLTKSVSLAV